MDEMLPTSRRTSHRYGDAPVKWPLNNASGMFLVALISTDPIFMRAFTTMPKSTLQHRALEEASG